MTQARSQWMRSMMQAGAVLTLWSMAAHAQMNGNQSTVQNGQSQSSGLGDPRSNGNIPKVPAAIQEKMAAQRNDERQKRLVADTAKLLALATQLKADVDKTDKYMLSIDVIKRSDEIDKLARDIRDRAKN